MRFSNLQSLVTFSSYLSVILAAGCDFWMEDIAHQGIASYNPSPSTYKVFRNVKTDYGAKGDGVTDDSAAINRAISDGSRCAPSECGSSTTNPAVVYFPPGTYLIGSSIIDYYYTQLIGNPNCMPVLKASSGFTDRFFIDGDQYTPGGGGAEGYGQTNLFWRQIRNFVVDISAVNPSVLVSGIHWPTGQATSLQNIVFNMGTTSNQQAGVEIEGGSGGFMADLVFNGGNTGAIFGNQQYTTRNLTFNNAVTAILQSWDWGWTYKGITINNCGIGLNMSANSVGSVTIFDSSISNTDIGILTSRNVATVPATANSLVIENLALNNVPIAVGGSQSTTVLAGGTTTIAGWADGHVYNPPVPTYTNIANPIAPNNGGNLLSGAQYYERSKPQYEEYDVSDFVSVRSAGATGNGFFDDSGPLQAVLLSAAESGKIVYFDAGYYLTTKTIYIPAGTRIAGEAYPVIMSTGSFFNDMNNPQPVVQVGKPGEVGTVEWSDMIVSTQGQQEGAILIQWNLAAPSIPAGMWDVHTRIGGFVGSQLQIAECPTQPSTTYTSGNIRTGCIAAFMSMHITESATNVYMENNWFWVADHDADDAEETRITVFAGRGLLVESTLGQIWMYGSAVEHHQMYQYQLSSTKNIYMGQIQTESPYYQPNPDARIPYGYDSTYTDPFFFGGESAWAMRILNSENIFVYGAGFYSFFNNYDVGCSTAGIDNCQSQIFDIQSPTGVNSLYNINSIGTQQIFVDGSITGTYSQDTGNFIGTIAMLRTSS